MARVLVIDDDDTMREGMAVTLKKAGHKVLAFRNGLEDGVPCLEPMKDHRRDWPLLLDERVLFQPLVEKAAELRVIIVGRETFVGPSMRGVHAAVRSIGDGSERVPSWRRSTLPRVRLACSSRASGWSRARSTSSSLRTSDTSFSR